MFNGIPVPLAKKRKLYDFSNYKKKTLCYLVSDVGPGAPQLLPMVTKAKQIFPKLTIYLIRYLTFLLIFFSSRILSKS